jgi:hypothetical protein
MRKKRKLVDVLLAQGLAEDMLNEHAEIYRRDHDINDECDVIDLHDNMADFMRLYGLVCHAKSTKQVIKVMLRGFGIVGKKNKDNFEDGFYE